MATTRDLFKSVTGSIDMISAEIITAYRTVCRRASVTSRNLGGLGIGDDISLDIGYAADHATLFSGRIRSISVADPRGTYVIDAEDALWQAKEYYFIPEDLDNPWSRSNISAEDLVEGILAEAGLTDYVGYATGFTFATGTQDVEIKLVSAWDFISWICEVVIYSPRGYYHGTHIITLPVSGTRFVAFIGTIVLLSLFYLFLKKTWWGRAFQGAAQNRMGIQTAGIDVFRLDQIAFGIGVALAAAAGALLAPEFYVHPRCGSIATMKGFEIIVIGGLGSIPGVLCAGLLLGLIESLGAVFLNPSFRDVYGFLFLLAILPIRPTGLFEERERVA